MENDEIPSLWIQDAAKITTENRTHYTTWAREKNVTASAIRNTIALSFREYWCPVIYPYIHL